MMLETAHLNPQQEEAVHYGEGPLLIKAGPGSGKTRCITQRIAHLIADRGISTSRILAITFTNKAAREMRERLEVLLGREALEDMFVGTFHAWCYGLLRGYGDLLGYAPQTMSIVAEESGRRQKLKKALRALDLDPRGQDLGKLLEGISRAQNLLYFSDEALPEEPEEARFLAVYQAYREALLSDNTVDFDELLSAGVRLLRDCPDVLGSCQARYAYILVDEFQDLNYAQYVLLRYLAQPHRNLCVVGDPLQGIYSWRGADIRYLAQFKEDYPEAREIALEQNYRSSTAVLNLANALSAGLEYGKRRLWTENSQGEPASFHLAEDEHGEARFVVREVQRLLDKGHLPSDCAVLYRTRSQARVLEAALLEAGLPYRIWGDRQRFLARKEIADILAYLEVAHNPRSSHALARIINFPPRGLPRVEKSLKEGEELDPQALASTPQGAAWLRLHASLIRQARDPDFDLSSFMDYVLGATGYHQWLSRQEYGRERLGNIHLLKSLAEGLPDRSLGGFLGSIALLEDPGRESDGQGVNLMTIHAAKGLEFRAVFVTGVEEGLVPLQHGRTQASRAEIEEELRVLYVAVTRARERLYLCRARTRQINGQRMAHPPSRFLRLLPDGCLAEASRPGVTRRQSR